MKRTNINWEATDELKLCVALAWYFFQCAKVRNKTELWSKVEEHLPDVSEAILTEGWTLDEIVKQVASTQDGLEVTQHKLLQRADKAERYSESDYFKAAIIDFLEVAGRRFGRDPIRSFTDQQLKNAIDIFGDQCIYCKIQFSDVVKPVADHYIPWSAGGRTDLVNCRPACVRCNEAKSNQQPHEFQEHILGVLGRGRDLGN